MRIELTTDRLTNDTTSHKGNKETMLEAIKYFGDPSMARGWLCQFYTEESVDKVVTDEFYEHNCVEPIKINSSKYYKAKLDKVEQSRPDISKSMEKYRNEEWIGSSEHVEYETLLEEYFAKSEALKTALKLAESIELANM